MLETQGLEKPRDQLPQVLQTSHPHTAQCSLLQSQGQTLPLLNKRCPLEGTCWGRTCAAMATVLERRLVGDTGRAGAQP